jgi:hypothetical protein
VVKTSPPATTRTLRLKIRRESYGWLNAAAVEVNEVFNYCNETSLKAATRTDTKRKWLSGFDLYPLTSGASPYFDKIGADTMQSICTHYAQKRQAARRLKLRWRVSRGSGVNGLIVRSWVCSNCGELLDRDVNAARNILIGSRCRTSVCGNEQSSWLIPPSRVYRVREAGIESAWAAA